MNENKNPLPPENRRNRANSLEFALRLFELNQPFTETAAGTEQFLKTISSDAFAINSFIEYEADTTERTRAIDISLRMTETYNREPHQGQEITADELTALARKVLDFMRHEATPLA